MSTDNQQNIIQMSGLGKKTDYRQPYSQELLFPIPRALKRAELGITEPLPFYGFDTWNDYETSWLDSQGKPVVAITTFHVPCTSPNIIESKSIKLYLNALADIPFSDSDSVKTLISRDFSAVAGSDVKVELKLLTPQQNIQLNPVAGTCIDQLDVACDRYEAYPDYLKTTSEAVISETLYSNLLKSNCPVTQQPDWGTLIVEYRGQALSRPGLLKYIVSLRNQYEFHEQCIERIFMHIMQQCQPQALTVIGRYTRRGGKDINPYRSTDPQIHTQNQRLIRQ